VGKTSGAAILWCILIAGPALADIPGCPKAEMPVAARKSLQKAAKRAFADPLDLATLYYCTDGDLARARVETIPVPLEDGSENGSTLMCSSPIDQPKHWDCEVERYREIRVTPPGGQPEVVIEVGDRATVELTRERAIRAFALLNESARVEACPGTIGVAQSSGSLRETLARREGPYRLIIAREGFALMRGHFLVRFNSGIECWEEKPGS
jgi:hypothetical protein